VALQAAIALPSVRRTSTRNIGRGTWSTGLWPAPGRPCAKSAIGDDATLCGAPSEWARWVTIGTERTNWADLMMSVDRGKPEVAFRGRQDRC
jgi:hypothetical protein